MSLIEAIKKKVPTASNPEPEANLTEADFVEENNNSDEDGSGTNQQGDQGSDDNPQNENGEGQSQENESDDGSTEGDRGQESGDANGDNEDDNTDGNQENGSIDSAGGDNEPQKPDQSGQQSLTDFSSLGDDNGNDEPADDNQNDDGESEGENNDSSEGDGEEGEGDESEESNGENESEGDGDENGNTETAESSEDGDENESDGIENDDGQSQNSDGDENGDNSDDNGVNPDPSHRTPPGFGEDPYEPTENFVENEAEQVENEKRDLEEEIEKARQELEEFEHAMEKSSGNGSLTNVEFNIAPDGFTNYPERWDEAEQDKEHVLDLLETHLKRARRDSWKRGQTNGRLDSKRLHAVKAKQLNVMERRDPGEKKRYSAIVVLDRSGSMNGGDIEIAEQALTTYVLALEKLDVDVMVMDMLHNQARVVKPFGVKAETVKGDLINGHTGGGTPLSDVIEVARERMEYTRDKPFMITITDGRPNDVDAYEKELNKTRMPVMGLTIASGRHANTGDPGFYDMHEWVSTKTEIERKLEQLTMQIAF